MRLQTKVLHSQNEYFCLRRRQFYHINCARVKFLGITYFLCVFKKQHKFVIEYRLSRRKGKLAKTPQKISLVKLQKPAIIESSTTHYTERSKMTTKAVNYTPEQSTKMVADYLAGVTVETIANELGKTVRSVVAKLSREKVYVAKTYVSKTGAPVVKKDAHADAIGAILKLTEAEIESLTKANKTALEKIFSALANSKPI